MDFYARIEGVDGDSESRGHEDWIEASFFDWSVAQAAGRASAGGGGRIGKPVFEPVRFTARTGRATPALLLLCATGRHAANATIEGVAEGDGGSVALRIELEDVLVTTLAMSGTDAGLGDTYALDYSTIRITTFRQDPRGGQATPATAGWDVRRSRPL